jgi:filamentous hemagglutinin
MPHPSVIRQFTLNACGNACGAMLLRSRGWTSVTQSNIAAAKGMVLSDGKGLAVAMNQLHPDGQWSGGQLDVWTDPLRTFNALASSGSFLTSIKSYGTKLHMVVVDGLDEGGRVIIRDPWGIGTRYLMNWGDFAEHWMGDTVWWGGH